MEGGVYVCVCARVILYCAAVPWLSDALSLKPQENGHQCNINGPVRQQSQTGVTKDSTFLVL